ncbi:MAG: O-antigen ligase family protein [Kiritimatiellae bacterium]|jgi:O-antigen ligase|nr:O-antigen ligase family protein [Kiritimatiellia bacterium]
MDKINNCLDWVGRFVVIAVIVLGLWLFGAWEMWYFWPFIALLSVGLVVLGLKGIVFALSKSKQTNPGIDNLFKGDVFLICLLSYTPFLLYAFVLFLNTEVRMVAERSFLLFATPIVLAALISYCFTSFWRRKLFSIIFFNLMLMGIYGIANYFITSNNYVLWRFWDIYQEPDNNRASGSLFCPDHFSAVMEFLFCMGIGLFFTKQTSKASIALGSLASVIGVTGVILSKSRGGGLTMVVLFAAIVIWGFSQLKITKNIFNRVSIICVVIMLAFVFMKSDFGYAQRFKKYFIVKNIPKNESVVQHYLYRMSLTSRGRMFGGAWRAWQSSPVIGVGPGMHQVVWPRFAATNDGNRENVQWPTVTNLDFHSYEVHNDWLQLLEEYGLVGFILFLFPCSVVFVFLRKKFLTCSKVKVNHIHFSWTDNFPRDSIQLGALLCFISMSFHSLGDFNLQIPGVLWTFTGILGVAITSVDIQYKRVRKPRSTEADTSRLS